jgi:hypothetical protein
MDLPIRNGPKLLPGDMDSSIRLASPVSSCFGDSCIDNKLFGDKQAVES